MAAALWLCLLLSCTQSEPEAPAPEAPPDLGPPSRLPNGKWWPPASPQYPNKNNAYEQAVAPQQPSSSQPAPDPTRTVGIAPGNVPGPAATPPTSAPAPNCPQPPPPAAAPAPAPAPSPVTTTATTTTTTTTTKPKEATPEEPITPKQSPARAALNKAKMAAQERINEGKQLLGDFEADVAKKEDEAMKEMQNTKNKKRYVEINNYLQYLQKYKKQKAEMEEQIGEQEAYADSLVGSESAIGDAEQKEADVKNRNRKAEQDTQKRIDEEKERRRRDREEYFKDMKKAEDEEDEDERLQREAFNNATRDDLDKKTAKLTEAHRNFLALQQQDKKAKADSLQAQRQTLLERNADLQKQFADLYAEKDKDVKNLDAEVEKQKVKIAQTKQLLAAENKMVAERLNQLVTLKQRQLQAQQGATAQASVTNLLAPTSDSSIVASATTNLVSVGSTEQEGAHQTRDAKSIVQQASIGSLQLNSKVVERGAASESDKASESASTNRNPLPDDHAPLALAAFEKWRHNDPKDVVYDLGPL